MWRLTRPIPGTWRYGLVWPALVICTVLFSASLPASGVRAATIPVTNCASSGTGSLAAAITNANAGAGGDTITFSVDCPVGNPIALGTQGISRPIAIRGNGAQRTTIQPAGGPIFQVSAGGNLTFADGAISGPAVNPYQTGTATFTNTAFSGASANTFSGDSIYNGGSGAVTAINSTFSSIGLTNASTGTVTITNGTFTGPGYGTSIFNYGTGTVVVSNSSFSGTYWGVYNPNGGRATVASSTFSGLSQAGIENYNGTATVTNSTFVRNGNGIHNGGTGTVTVTNGTLVGNTFGIYNQGGSDTVTVRNTIIAANDIANQGLNNCVGAISDGSHNLAYGASGPDTSCPATFTRNEDPKLGPLANNGGPTQTVALLAGSPAIDAAGGSCPATDQRGIPRPLGTACDIGAYELMPPPNAMPPSRGGPYVGQPAGPAPPPRSIPSNSPPPGIQPAPLPPSR